MKSFMCIVPDLMVLFSLLSDDESSVYCWTKRYSERRNLFPLPIHQNFNCIISATRNEPNGQRNI